MDKYKLEVEASVTANLHAAVKDKRDSSNDSNHNSVIATKYDALPNINFSDKYLRKTHKKTGSNYLQGAEQDSVLPDVRDKG